jgi:general secretion pathway protein I
MARTRNQKGFTLVEVMVAVAVFAVGAAALALAASQSTINASRLEEKSLARMVAQNQLTLVREEALPSPGENTQTITFAQRPWKVQTKVSPVEMEFIGPMLRQVEVLVFLDDDSDQPVDRLFAVVGQY